MPHIHTEPGQHDITASAWIIRVNEDIPKVLVHMHRKIGKLMEIGGHIELNETPWQTLAHEIPEESGYDLGQLKVLQPLALEISVSGAIVHPVPALSNTHKQPNDHFHSDYCYAFVADSLPVAKPAEGESQDLRWLTIAELQQSAKKGETLLDVAEIYGIIVNKILPHYSLVDTTTFDLAKPNKSLTEN